MKKLFVLIAMTALLFSCEKEPVTSSMNYLEVDTTSQDSIDLTQDTAIIIYDSSVFIMNDGRDTIRYYEPVGTNFDTVVVGFAWWNPRLQNSKGYLYHTVIIDKWEKVDDNDTIIQFNTHIEPLLDWETKDTLNIPNTNEYNITIDRVDDFEHGEIFVWYGYGVNAYLTHYYDERCGCLLKNK